MNQDLRKRNIENKEISLTIMWKDEKYDVRVSLDQDIVSIFKHDKLQEIYTQILKETSHQNKDF